MTNPFMPTAQPQQQQQSNPFAPAPAPAAQAQPQYAQQAPQQSNPYAAQQGQQQAPNALVARPGQFIRPSAPSESGNANMPRVSDLQGRLLLVMPEKIEYGVAGRYGVQDRMTATVVVLDGGPLQWGGTQPNSQRQQANVPYVIKGLWIQQSKLVQQLMEAYNLRASGGPGLALGRLWKAGTGQNDPYVMAEPNEQDAQMYDHYVSQINPFTL